MTTFGEVWSPRLAFSPDGRVLACGGLGSGPRLVDIESGRDVWSIADGMVLELAMSPDGKAILTVEMEHVRLWNAATGDLIREVEGGFPACGAFSPDGRLFATGEEDAVRVRTVATGEVGRTFKAEGAPSSVAFSPDGWELAWTVLDTGCELVRADLTGGGLTRWSCAAPGRPVDDARRSTLSRDLAQLALSSPTELVLWRVGASRPAWQASFEPWSNAAAVTSFSTDGERLAVGAGRWQVTLRDAQTGAVRTTLLR